jgi:hypothetical protein
LMLMREAVQLFSASLITGLGAAGAAQALKTSASTVANEATAHSLDDFLIMFFSFEGDGKLTG